MPRPSPRTNRTRRVPSPPPYRHPSAPGADRVARATGLRGDRAEPRLARALQRRLRPARARPGPAPLTLVDQNRSLVVKGSPRAPPRVRSGRPVAPWGRGNPRCLLARRAARAAAEPLRGRAARRRSSTSWRSLASCCRFRSRRHPGPGPPSVLLDVLISAVGAAGAACAARWRGLTCGGGGGRGRRASRSSRSSSSSSASPTAARASRPATPAALVAAERPPPSPLPPVVTGHVSSLLPY